MLVRQIFPGLVRHRTCAVLLHAGVFVQLPLPQVGGVLLFV